MIAPPTTVEEYLLVAYTEPYTSYRDRDLATLEAFVIGDLTDSVLAHGRQPEIRSPNAGS